MIKPHLMDDAFLEDVQRARAARNTFHLWWLGQSGFLLKWEDHHVLLDPYLSDSLTRKYAGTNKPHVRMTTRIVAPEKLNFIDVVTSSHNHTDHLDAETIVPLVQLNPNLQIVVPEANRPFAAEHLGLRPERLLSTEDGKTVEASGFQFTGVPSAHEQLERDEHGRCRFLGYVIQFGSWTVYHSGDTVLYEGMVERLRPWRIDVALLPINGRAPERGVAGNLNGREAAWLGRQIEARLVIPCHYEMFEFNTASPDAFMEEAEKLKQPHRVLRCGERCTF